MGVREDVILYIIFWCGFKKWTLIFINLQCLSLPLARSLIHSLSLYQYEHGDESVF